MCAYLRECCFYTFDRRGRPGLALPGCYVPFAPLLNIFIYFMSQKPARLNNPFAERSSFASLIVTQTYYYIIGCRLRNIPLTFK